MWIPLLIAEGGKSIHEGTLILHQITDTGGITLYFVIGQAEITQCFGFKRANMTESIKRDSDKVLSGNSLNFWGKASSVEGSGTSWHPLAYHSFDVAAAGKAVLKCNDRLRGMIAATLGVDENLAVSLCVFLLSLHDLGKFSRSFQAKEMTELYWRNFNEDPKEVPSTPRHSDAGWLVWDACIGNEVHENYGLDRYSLDPLARAVFGHHGEPPNDNFGGGNSFNARRVFGGAGLRAAKDFAGSAARILLLSTDFAWKEKNAECASYPIAGLAVLSDWLGSNQDWFPYCSPEHDLAYYWERVAKEAAGKAVEMAGVVPAKPARKKCSFSALVPNWNKNEPTEMQKWVENAPLPDGPTLFIIEDVTGSGKTEAALMLAHRLIVAGRANGLYVGLPTQATANAMFERVKEIYRKLFDEEIDPSLVLAHGARDFYERFKEMKLSAGPPDNDYGQGSKAEDATATSQCDAWIKDNKKKTFLADIGVGTVDQAILSVLPRRHQSLRLVGLAQHVLILDEIHAYDAYVQQELIGLLEFQAAFGGDVILLSATLPEGTRQRFIYAWKRGCQIDSDGGNGAVEDAYPLATTVSCEGIGQHSCKAARMSHRKVAVRFLSPKDDSAIKLMLRAAREGQAAVYIRNTVDDAIATWEKLCESDNGLEPILFHARFAMCDRIKIEKQVLNRFGKGSCSKDRRGQVLVATQVVEQSLDLDFDFMVSDLAPVDLLIQRAGRLWRHDERKRPGSPELFVVSPDPVKDAGSDWMKQAFPRAAWVYKDHARLWLTARALKEAGVICTPDDLRTLVESVYGADAEDQIPPALENSRLTMEGEAGADRGVARQNLLKLPGGYSRAGTSWEDDTYVPTRQGETVTLRLARFENGEVVPWASGGNGESNHTCWQLSEVRVRPNKRISSEVVPAHLASAAENVRKDWKRWERDVIRLVILEKTGQNGWSADSVLHYGVKTGLKFLIRG